MNYTTTERKLLNTVENLKYLHTILLVNRIKLYTYHKISRTRILQQK